MKKLPKIILIYCFLFLLSGAPLVNALSISLNSNNVGITSFSYSISGSNIDIYETWGNVGYGFLEINGLVTGQNYYVTKHITNNTGLDWDRFANELLDPLGQSDTTYDGPTPGWVPSGFSRSNDYDGLSFAQGSGIPQLSAAFSGLVVDELSTIDFIDFFNGTVSGTGGIDTVKFGLRTNQAVQQPFLLAERPNESSVSVPDASVMLLLGSSLFGLGVFSRKSKKS